jgi:hypothetical protein
VTWTPDPTVRIGGVDYTADTVGRVSFSRGRADVDSPPAVSRAQVTLRDATGTGLGIEVGSDLEVFVDNSVGTAVQVFGGQVQQVSLSTVSTGSGDAVVVWQVQASGPLARMNRRTILFDGRPSEDDGERVAAAVSAGLGESWEEYGPVAWSAVNESWATVDPGYDAALIDPGVYMLAALGSADGGYSALTVAQDAAFSARGVLYETRDGFVGYADANRRQAAGTGVFLELPTGAISQSGLGFRQDLTSLVNRATVEYDGGAYTASDLESIWEFGVFQTEFTTQLASAAAGSAVATEWVLDRAFPAYELDEVTVTLNSVGTALRDALLEVEPNDPVEITGMPAGAPLGSLRGFVESVSMSVDQFTALVTLDVSDSTLSIGAARWNTIGTAVTWDSVGTAVAWSAARSL